jgi:hypothetical protein
VVPVPMLEQAQRVDAIRIVIPARHPDIVIGHGCDSAKTIRGTVRLIWPLIRTCHKMSQNISAGEKTINGGLT